MSDKEIGITPLAAAIVEAMPDRKLTSRIKRRFDKLGECPSSMIFTIEDVEGFYRREGKTIRGVKPIATTDK